MSKARGILMKGEMIQAYLDGRKRMTRRTRGLDLINENPDDWKFTRFVETIKRSTGVITKHAEFQRISGPGLEHIRLPYGWIGDRLYFKETYRTTSTGTGIMYRADGWEKVQANYEMKWKSSMFMPRKFSRFEVPITNVRVERLLDISMEDVEAEGTPDIRTMENNYTMRDCFFALWNSINEKRGHGSAHNDWLFVYEFPVITQEARLR